MGMIQIRNVPDDVHRRLKARAAEEGLSLSDFLRRLAEREAARPTAKELLDRLARLPPVETDVDPVAILREIRDRS